MAIMRDILSVVIARESGQSSPHRLLQLNGMCPPHRHGLLDAPLSRGMTPCNLLVAGLVLGFLAAAPRALAQDYPTRPIRAITATGAGGTSDVFMRVLGDELHKRWGQPIIVENRPGGGMTIGGRACAEAPNDGYTICNLPGETLVYNQFLFKKISYDPEKDFEPITNPFFNTQVLVVSSALNVRTLDELAVLSKAKPGTLSYTVPSIPLALLMEQWKEKSGADLVRVPFKGGGDAVNGVLTGATPIAFFGLANWIPLLQNGTVRGLAVDGAARFPLFPDIPTLDELGFSGNRSRVYFGMVAPAGTPKPVIHRLRNEIARIGNDPTFRQKRLVEMGLEPIFDTPDQFARFLSEDRAAFARIFRESGLQPQ
jgi:tripartite-type tricarboxylate transporter receptor subunit TctC